MWNKNMSPEDAALLIQRFLEGKDQYPQEWNDFVETPQRNQRVENYRGQCYDLDPLVNRPGTPDPAAVARLREIISLLRAE